MKAILKFDLEDADDRLEHLRCIKATDMALVLWEFHSNSMRTLDDWIVEGTDPHDVIDKVFEHFNDILTEYDVTPDQLIR